jgi:PIN domain nuclease of toxin-antitoxin system
LRLLLDTNAVIWWLEESDRLGAAARNAIEDGNNQVFVSAVTACEMAIKSSIGKLRTPTDLEQQIVASSFTDLPVTVQHGVAVQALPLHHRDPFDRILIAQAQCEGLTLVSRDRRFSEYDVPVLKA